MSTMQTREQTPQIVRHAGPVVRRVGPAGQAAGGITGRDVLRIIRKRKWLIILPTLLLTAAAVVGTMLWRQHAPEYTAEAFLQVTPGSADIFAPQRDPRADVVERQVLAQAQMVTSEVVLRAALETPQVTNLAWYREHSTSLNIVEDLRDIVSVSAVPNTDLIRISVQGPDKNEVADLATAIATAHVADVRKSTGSADEATISLLRSQLSAKQAQLADIRNDQRRARTRSRSPSDLAAQGGTLRARMEAYGRQLTQAGLAVTQARGVNEALKKQQASGELVNSPEVTAVVETDPRLRTLRQRLDALDVEIQRKISIVGPNHRDVKALEIQKAAVKKQIDERTNEIQDYQVKALVERSRSAVDSYVAQQLQIKEQYDSVEARVQEIEAILIELGQLATQEEQVKEEVERIDRRITDLSLARANRVPVSLRRRAERPDEISFPKFEVLVPIGVVVGLLIGFGLAFLLELVDTSVRSPADVLQRTNMAVLGTVPHTRDLDEDIDDVRKAFADNRGSLLGEAFRHVRTCLRFSGPAEHRRSVLVTSPLPDDGRTTVTVNLAASIARAGQKVLVIDTNFRQPVSSRLFVENGASVPGLSNVLVGQSAWKDVIHEVEANLHIMPTGPLPPNPAELLGSDPMRQLQAELFEQYDQILLDGAPCLVVTDAAILSTVVDGVVLVVRAGANTYGMVQRAGQSLERIGARVLGTVVNGVRATVGGYLRENYDRFYDYQEQGELPAE